MDIVDDMRKDKIVQINNELTKTDTAQSRSGHDNPSNRGLKIIYQSIFNSLPNKSKLKDMSYFRKRNSLQNIPDTILIQTDRITPLKVAWYELNELGNEIA